MLKNWILLLAGIGCSLAATAQDLIVKIDSTRIEARVAEISTDAVRYKRYARPDGPTYVLPTAQICYIRYADGFMEDYNRAPQAAAAVAQQTPAPTPTPVPAPVQAPTPAPAPTPTPIPTVQTEAAPAVQAAPVVQPQAAPAPAPATSEESVERFDLGQIYDRGGVRGIVVKLNEDRTHGLVMSIDQAMLAWSTFRKGEYCLVGANDRMNGEANMEAVARYIAEHNLTWDHFPAFKWCREKGEGWYLPAIDELLTIGNNYNGGNRQHNNRQCRTRWNENMKTAGGDRLDLKRIYYSSSELNAPLAMMAHMSIEVPYLYNMHEDTPDPIQKYVTFLVRAVHKF